MFGTATIKARPIKFALLVDPNNSLQVREAIRLACGLWGGAFFPIIPLHKRRPTSWRSSDIRLPSAKEFVQGYIEAFDPDMLVNFSQTVPAYISELRLKILDPEDVWYSNLPRDEPEPAFGLSVLDILQDIYNECFKYKPKFPTKVVIPIIPKEFGLLWSSVYGEYQPQLSGAVEKLYAEVLEIERPRVTPDSIQSLTSPSVLFPRRITSWAVSSSENFRGSGQRPCGFYMDATSIEDNIDYWNLRAMGRSVVPIPKQLTDVDSLRSAVIAFFVKSRQSSKLDSENFGAAPIICSRNSSIDEMSEFSKTLELPIDDSASSSRRYFALQAWYPRVWDEWARDKDGGVADIYGEEQETIDIGEGADFEMSLKPLLPKFAQNIWHVGEAICANEFDLRVFGANEHVAQVYPKVRGDNLARAISGITGLRDEWRIGRHGPVKLVRDSISERRKLPASETIFFAWLADKGWTAELSPPGILAKQIYKRLGGLVAVLGNKSVLNLFEHMNGGLVSRKTNKTTSTDDWIGGTREVAVGEVKSRLTNSEGQSGIYDLLLERGAFKLGLKSKCPNCLRRTWFSLAVLNETLDCPKCLTPFAAAGNIDQSSGGWFYRAAGPFSVPNYADGAFAVLLTLNALDDRMIGTMRTTCVPSFTAKSSKAQLEADFGMFWREAISGEQSDGLLFGECKTFGLFEAKDFERMRHIGDTFPGAVLVFSTLRETLTQKEIDSLTRLAKTGRKYWKAERPINPVLILTGNELLGWQRPPHCWNEELQKRFRHVRSLLSICNATQQIYLALPPWSEDWESSWEKRRKRRALRAS